MTRRARPPSSGTEIHWRNPETADIRRGRPRHTKRRLLVLASVAGSAAVVAVALAAWLSSGSGATTSGAQQVSSGNQPAATVAGSSVSLSWTASALSPGGQPVSGYVVRRYDSGGTPQIVGPNCNGTVSGLGCTETNVPNGTWRYSVTPVLANWVGPESTRVTVTVAAPTVTATSPSSRAQGWTGNVTVAGTNFQSGATATFSGTGITVNSTTFVDSSHLTANITISPSAAIGARDVTVTNPDSGTGTCVGCFTVNPAPTVTSANPNFGFRSQTENVTVIGTGFVSGATASFSGTGITINSTTFVDSSHLTVNVTIGSTAATGARNVTVTNPDAGTGTCTGCFTVVLAPTVTSTSPSSRGQGATNQSITVVGNYFLSGATVSFSRTFGFGLSVNSTTFVDSSHLVANITLTTTATTGAWNVTVTNPGGFGTGTCTGCFTVTARPGTFTLTPNSRGQGATNQNITINGSNFQSGAAVLFSGTGITVNLVTFVSSTQLTANISVATNATTGSRSVTVTNPDAGTRTITGAFTVNPRPIPTSVSPSSGPQGGGPGNATLSGTGFVNGATVSLSGTGYTVNSVTFVSSTQLTVNGSIAQDAATGARDVTVTNPDGGTGTCTGCFTITAGPKPTSVSPSSRARSTIGNVTIAGTNFQSGATVSFSGTGITVNSVTFNTSTQLTVNITISAGAATGARDVTVSNPDGGVGTCAGCFTVT